MATDPTSLVQELQNIAECNVCRETFKDPKILPCTHTFCRRCLSQIGSKSRKRPGDEMSCPTCSSVFNIPTNGFEGLPINVFLARLIERKNILSGSVRISCDLCPPDRDQDSSAVAVKHCNVCQLNLCERCCIHHEKSKLTKQHTLARGAKESFEIHESRLCDKHIDEELKIFCHLCVEICCSMCFIENHSGHEWSLIEEVASDLKSQIRSNVVELSACIRETESKKETFKFKESKIRKSTREIEKVINEQRNRLKEIVDKHAESLISDLKKKENSCLNKIEIASNDLDRHLAILKSFGSYCTSIVETGTDIEICRVKNDLILRSKALREDNTKELQHQVNPFFVSFTATNTDELPLLTKEQLIGRLEECNFAGEIVLLYTITTKAAEKRNLAVWGVAHLNDDIFISTSNCSIIEVYSAESFAFHRNWSLEGLKNPQDIAACGKNNCLYIIDWSNEKILRTDPDGSVKNRWSVGNYVGRLSITKESNILLTAQKEGKLVEYDSDGFLLRTIDLPSAFRPEHAIKRGIGEYLVCRGSGDGNSSDDDHDSSQSVCIVNDNGEVVKSISSFADRIDKPLHMAMTRSGCVLVADWKSRKVLVLNSSFRYPKEIVVPGNRHPCRLCLDETNRRLYIAHNANAFYGGKVSVYAL